MCWKSREAPRAIGNPHSSLQPAPEMQKPSTGSSPTEAAPWLLLLLSSAFLLEAVGFYKQQDKDTSIIIHYPHHWRDERGPSRAQINRQKIELSGRGWGEDTSRNSSPALALPDPQPSPPWDGAPCSILANPLIYSQLGRVLFHRF